MTASLILCSRLLAACLQEVSLLTLFPCLRKYSFPCVSSPVRLQYSSSLSLLTEVRFSTHAMPCYCGVSVTRIFSLTDQSLFLLSLLSSCYSLHLNFLTCYTRPVVFTLPSHMDPIAIQEQIATLQATLRPTSSHSVKIQLWWIFGLYIVSSVLHFATLCYK